MLIESGSGVKTISARAVVRHQQRCYKISAIRNTRKTKGFLNNHPLSPSSQGLCYKISGSCNIQFLLGYWHTFRAVCYKMTLQQPPDIWIFWGVMYSRVHRQPKEAAITQKYPICPDRIRTLPQQFSWIDQRLVRDRYIEGLSHEAAALYLFLVTVADRQGLSFYADSGIGTRLGMDDTALTDARNQLLRAELIAYKKPLFQVLALEGHHETRTRAAVPSSEDIGPASLREILRQISGERR